MANEDRRLSLYTLAQVDPGAMSLSYRVMLAISAVLAIVTMHAVDTDSHLCHTSLPSVTEPGGAPQHDGDHHGGSEHNSCAVVACMAIVLSAVLFVASRRSPRDVWPGLLATMTTLNSRPEPPVPRFLLPA